MKTTVNFFLTVISLILFSCATQAKDSYTSKQIAPGEFKSLQIFSIFETTFEPSDTYSVEFEIPQKAINNLIAKKEGNTLILGFQDVDQLPQAYLSQNKPIAKIKAPSFEHITLSGAVDLTFKGLFHIQKGTIRMSGSTDIKGGNIQAEKIEIDLSGASDCTLNIAATTATIKASGSSDAELTINTQLLKATCSGSSDIQLKNTTHKIGKRLEAKLSGASDLSASKAPFQQITIKASGASDASIYPTQALKAYASGSSTIQYIKEASLTNIDVEDSGAGSIKAH